MGVANGSRFISSDREWSNFRWILSLTIFGSVSPFDHLLPETEVQNLGVMNTLLRARFKVVFGPLFRKRTFKLIRFDFSLEKIQNGWFVHSNFAKQQQLDCLYCSVFEWKHVWFVDCRVHLGLGGWFSLVEAIWRPETVHPMNRNHYPHDLRLW